MKPKTTPPIITLNITNDDMWLIDWLEEKKHEEGIRATSVLIKVLLWKQKCREEKVAP